MKKIFLNSIIVSFILAAMLLSNINITFAASYSVSVSSKSVKSGEKITVSISGDGCEGSFKVSVNNGASVTGYNTIWTGESTTVVAGSNNFTITISPQSVTSSTDGSKIENFKSKSFNISIKTVSSNNTTSNNTTSNNTTSSNNTTNNNKNNNQTSNEPEKSSDNTLKSLTVSKGTLSPSFKASKTAYNIELAGDVTEVSINAKTNDSKATVSGIGKKSVKVGENKFNVVCTAENGTKKTYTLTFHVDETPLVYTKFNDIDLGVVRILDNVKVPSGFEKSTIELEDKKIDGYTNEKLKLDIAYLVDESGNKDFYIIKDSKVYSVFKKININGKEYVITEPNENLEQIKDLKNTKLTIDKTEINGWSFEEEKLKNYTLLYLMNSKGEYHLYSYETTEGSLQIYSEFQREDNILSNEMTYILIGTSCFFAFTTIFVLLQHLHFKKKKITEIREFYKKRNNEAA